MVERAFEEESSMNIGAAQAPHDNARRIYRKAMRKSILPSMYEPAFKIRKRSILKRALINNQPQNTNCA
jgi:hypothetical protein